MDGLLISPTVSLRGKLLENSCNVSPQNAQAKMMAMTIAIALTHERFGAIVFAFHEAIRNAGREKLEKGENFLPPIHKGRKSFPQMIELAALHLLNPSVQTLSCRGSSRGGIPGT